MKGSKNRCSYDVRLTGLTSRGVLPIYILVIIMSSTDLGELAKGGGVEFRVNRINYQHPNPPTNNEPSSDNASNLANPEEGNNSVYETKYQKSLIHYLTREALPKESHYRNLNSIIDGQTIRPTLEDLHEDTFHGRPVASVHEEFVLNRESKRIKFGWIKGVFMRCLLNIWGVILFLRVSWMVGQAGIWLSCCIVLLANVLTVITAISMSAVATNGSIKAGGIYFMISRQLGPEFGGSIGLMFILANSIGASTYTIGFVNALQSMLSAYFGIEDITGAGNENDVRVFGTITLIFVLILAIIGMEWVTRVQMALLVLLLAAHANFVIGSFMGPRDSQEKAQGFIGFSGEVFQTNMAPDFRFLDGKKQSFFSVYGVFFPAVTGIVAGANLSGDLKNPEVAIPKGTILAIAVTFITYMIYPFLIASSMVRHASGNVTEYEEFKDNPIYENPAFNISSQEFSCYAEGKAESSCNYGLQNDYQVMALMSAFGPLIYVGCFAATLSSAIASLVGAPRVLQALARDKLYPLLYLFEKGYGPNNDPVRGYFLVFIISFLCIMIGDLNAVSTLLTNFFLAAYALINFSCFHSSLVDTPGWRPSFRYYNLWVSLLGGILCVVFMFFIDWLTALVTFALAIILFMYVSYRKPDVNWGSSTQAQSYLTALKATLDLVHVEEHVKNYRPQILVLCGAPSHRPPLIDFAFCLTKGLALLDLGNVVKGPITQKTRNNLTKSAYLWMDKHKIKAFYSVVEGHTLEEGARSMYQLVGLGKLRPNMVLLGYKSDWRTCDPKDLQNYFLSLHEALDMHLGIAILRVDGGLDYSKFLDEEDTHILSGEHMPSVQSSCINMESMANGDFHKVVHHAALDESPKESSSVHGSPKIRRSRSLLKRKKNNSSFDLYKGPGETAVPTEILEKISRFQLKQKKGTIDVWWLYDDGGLTLLLPYILTSRSQWHGCKLRVFVLANRKDELEVETRSMANLLAKFRIDFNDMTVIPDVAKKAKEASRKDFEGLIKDFKVKKNQEITKENEGLLISEAEILGQKEKTNRHIRLRELLLENSKDSSLIVMTLPMPRKHAVSAPHYMAWLETLTKDMPPFLLIRGNQSSVLTFYS